MNPPLPNLNDLTTPWVLIQPGPEVRSNIKNEFLPHLILLLRQAEQMMVQKSMSPEPPRVTPVQEGALRKFLNGRR